MTLMICFFKEHTPRIFEPCYSTKEAEMSTGLFALYRNKTMKILKVVLSLFLYISFISNLQAKSLENISIQLKWFNQYQFAGIYIAKEKGFYEEEGLNVEIKERDPKKNNVLQVIEGESEYGVAESVILRYRAEGHKVKVIATIFQHNALVLISKKGSGILSPYEMKGKKIAFQEGLDDSIISGLLTFAHMGTNEYIKMPKDYSHMDFVNDKVDITEAYISDQPYWLKEKYGIDVNIIDPKNYGMNFYGDLIFTTEEEAEKHPLRVKKFKEATLRGWKYALEHQDEAIKIILDKYNTRDLKYEQLQYEARVTKNLIASDYIPLGDVRKERFEMLTRLYQGKGISSAELHKAVDTIIYNPDVKENVFLEYLYYIISIAVSSLLLILFLFFNNRRLHYLVKAEVQKNQAQNMQMFHQSRLAQMGEMLSMIAHQWRQPLAAIAATSIDMQLKIELETFDLNKESERVSCISYFTKGLGKIDMFTNSLSTTIDDFRNFQNPNKKLSSGTICDTIESALKIIKPMLESQNIIIEEKYDEPKEIEFFANEMAQVLLNILKNALDNFKEKASLNPKIVIKSKNMLSGVVIEICDNGGGIPDAIIDKIFDPYFSTKNEKNGTGLGLYMSKIIIEDHHSGKLKVLNSDEGVCFSIELKEKI